MGRPRNKMPCKYLWAAVEFDNWAKNESRKSNTSTAEITHQLLHKFIIPYNIGFEKPKLRIDKRWKKI